ncbi:MAG: HNH endonuclease, partial [Bryobacteraceae bacterium]
MPKRMEWPREVVKKNGEPRKQYQQWGVPAYIREQFRLEDGDKCKITISLGAYRSPTTEYVLTSGGEFYLSKPIAKSLASIAENEPASKIVFDIQVDQLVELRAMFDKMVEEEQRSEELTPEDARNRVLASILQRPAQARFRADLLRAYGNTCAISDSDYPEALEAAHIVPYADGGKDQITNGLLLRADLHRLFDQHKIRIDPVTRTVIVSCDLKKTVYQSLHGKPLRPPANPAHRPKFPV